MLQHLADRAFRGFIALTTLIVGLVSYRYLVGAGPLAGNVMANSFYDPWLALHVASAATALLAGPLQFVRRLRRARPRLHRWLGKTYVAGCLLGGLSGFVLAFGSSAGPVATAGFGLLAVGWTFATAQAWRLAMLRRFDEHRAWMLRSFAMTFAAVTLRLGLVAAALAEIPMLDAYRALSFVSWLPQLVLVELWLARRRPAWRRRAPASALQPLHDPAR